MQYNIHAAKTNLSKLIEAAENGEEVVIARGNRPVVRIVPVVSEPLKWSETKTRSGFKFGLLQGIVKDVPDFFEPMSEEDLQLWEGGGDDRGSA